jgi:hypothetical protein
VYEPEARVIHHVPAARATAGYYAARCYAEGVSKARVAALVGGRDATASERRHAMRALPAGMVREVRRGRLLRGAAIAGGLLTVAAGFVVESAWRRRDGAF